MAKANPAQIQHDLKGIDYPANKQKLVEHAQQHGASENVLSVLKQLPEQDYGTPVEVSKAIGDLE
ncbi:MAG: DUF2795 domain-containing protein [Leptolyngbyaceae bacterium]|nr:DUF2795 domain-containing protein [Leptolyngbyaceae bacterium]